MKIQASVMQTYVHSKAEKRRSYNTHSRISAADEDSH